MTSHKTEARVERTLRMSHLAIIAFHLALLGGCSARGVAEFEAYRSATLKANDASTAILDQTAVQERALFLKGQTERQRREFHPRQATYFTDIVDPPATLAFRHALQTVILYNDLLYGLSSGQTADALTDKLGALNTSLTQAITTSASLSTSANGEMAAAGVAINAAFTAVRPFVRSALRAQSQERFRYYVVYYYPTVREVLLALRDSTQQIFPILTAPLLNRIRATGGSAEDIEKLKTYRKLMADWVVLLDASIAALTKAKDAAEAPATALNAVEGLTAAATELNSAAEAARRDLAQLATK